MSYEMNIYCNKMIIVFVVSSTMISAKPKRAIEQERAPWKQMFSSA